MSTRGLPDVVEMKKWCERLLRFLLSKEPTGLERQVLLSFLTGIENADPNVNPKGVRAAYIDLVAMFKHAPESLRREFDEVDADSTSQELRNSSNARWDSLVDDILHRRAIRSPEERQLLLDVLDKALENSEPDERLISRIRELLEEF